MEKSNFVELVGTIRWPEVKNTLSGSKLFKAAVVIETKNGSNYFRIVAWDKIASAMSSLKENDKVRIQGRLTSRSYDSKCKTCEAAHKVYVTEVVVDSFVKVG